jgi:hypothetical protein
LWHAHRCDSSHIRAEARLAPGMNEADTCRKQVVPLLQNWQYMRQFYLAFPPDRIGQTLSGKSALNIRSTLSSKSETLSRILALDALAGAFPLLWAHYILATRGHGRGGVRVNCVAPGSPAIRNW